MNTYELQLFDYDANEYVPVEKGDDPQSLMNQAKGMARRVINAFRGNPEYEPRFGKNYAKPLPLKPRVPYGCSGKPRKYKPETMIEPASPEELAKRAYDYYVKRAKSESAVIPVYVWKNSSFGNHLRYLLAEAAGHYKIIELDPNEYL